MPLPEELRKGLDSTVADLANVAPESAMAACWSRGFSCGNSYPTGFVGHIWTSPGRRSMGEPYGYTPKGGTGAAVRTLVQVAMDVADGQL